MDTKPIYAVAWTGHRPQKLGGYEAHERHDLIREQIGDLINRAVAKHGTTHQVVMITGGALGVDQFVADKCIDLNIPFVIVAPIDKQYAPWPTSSISHYMHLRGCANARLAKMLGEKLGVGHQIDGGRIVLHPGEKYDPKQLQVRNQVMVDLADALVAIWDGSPGGTRNCVQYADLKGLPKIISAPVGGEK